MRGRRRANSESIRPVSVSKGVRGTCNMLAMVMLAYAAVAGDVPVGMLAVAVVTGTIPPSGRVFQVTFGDRLRSALHAFSLTLFIGAVAMLLL